MAKVFISYSRANIGFVRKLKSAFEESKIDLWIDLEGVRFTADWWDEIKRGIENADNFLLVMTPDTLSSPVCHMEIEYALKLKKRLIAVEHLIFQRDNASKRMLERLAAEGYVQSLLGDRSPILLFNNNYTVIDQFQRIPFPYQPESDADDEANFATHFEKLRKAVETDIEHANLHTRIGLRVREWERNQQNISYLLYGDELREAEKWLSNYDAAPRLPGPTSVQRNYIKTSRSAENRRTGRLRTLSALTGLLLMIALAAGIFSANAVSSANVANAQLTAVLPTLTSAQNQFISAQGQVHAAETQIWVANQQLATATQALVTATSIARFAATGEAELEGVNTQVAFALATVTQAAVIDEITTGFANALLQYRNDPEAQLAAMQAVVMLYHDQPLAYLTRGQVYAAQGQYIQAIADYDESIRLDPQASMAYYNRGIAHNELGDAELAIADYSAAIQLDPRLVPAYVNRGAIYSDLGQYESALEDFDEAIRLNPIAPFAHSWRGIAYANLGETDAAIADFNRAIFLNSQDSDAFNNRGTVYALLGDYERAIEDFNEAILIETENANAYYNRGTAYSNLGDYGKAVVDFGDAIRLEPEFFDAYFDRGLAYAYLREFELALNDYNSAIILNPQDAKSYYQRGMINIELDDTEHAISDFSEAIRLDPLYAAAFNNRGIVQIVLGFEETNPEEQLAYFRQGIADLKRAEALGYELTPQIVDTIAQIEADYLQDN